MALLHICGAGEWEDVGAGPYRPPTLAVDGFIHLSRPDQVHKPANRFHRGRDDLVLLVIDEERLVDEVRWEPSAVPEERGERFPHLYGPLPLDAVVDVVPFPADPDGGFTVPVELRP